MTGQERQSPQTTAQDTEPEALHLEVGLSSDTGPSRGLNEDYVDYYMPSDEAQIRLKGSIFIVADGMGGHLAGEVASKEAVRRVMEEYYADPSPDPGESLGRAISAANHLLHEHASSDPAKSGMGTTLVAAVIIGSSVHIANVGDSRAYGISKDTIHQITRDHSWV
jgi:protein phosphatase